MVMVSLERFAVDITFNLAEIFTAWQEKMCVFLHVPQQTTDLKFSNPLKMKSTT